MINPIVLENGLIGADASYFFPVLYHNNCTFSVAPIGPDAVLGDVDIERILYGVRATAARGDSIAAEGSLPCLTSDRYAYFDILWRVHGGRS